MTYRLLWGHSRVTSSAQRELKTEQCHIKRASLASWLVIVVYEVATGVASGEVVAKQCSAADCLNYVGILDVSFISLFP